MSNRLEFFRGMVRAGLNSTEHNQQSIAQFNGSHGEYQGDAVRESGDQEATVLGLVAQMIEFGFTDEEIASALQNKG